MARTPVDPWEELEPLYSHFDGMVRSIRRAAGGDAEDIVQGAFMHVKDKLDNGYHARNLKGLLETVIRNNLNDYLDANRRELEVKEEAAFLAEHPDVGSIENHMLALDMNSALENMPESQARPFVITEIQGATSSEAAYALDMTPNAVRINASRARKRLRKDLA